MLHETGKIQTEKQAPRRDIMFAMPIPAPVYAFVVQNCLLNAMPWQILAGAIRCAQCNRKKEYCSHDDLGAAESVEQRRVADRWCKGPGSLRCRISLVDILC